MELKALLEDDEDRLRILFQELLQELLEQKMTRALAVKIHDDWLGTNRYLNMDDLKELIKEQLRKAA